MSASQPVRHPAKSTRRLHDFGERMREFGEFPTVDFCLIGFSGEARDYYFHSRLIAPIIDEQCDPLFRTLRIPVDFQDLSAMRR